MLGIKTPEKLANLLTSEDSQSVAPYNISQSAVVDVVHSKDSSPILSFNSSVFSVDSGSEDSDRVSTVLVTSKVMTYIKATTLHVLIMVTREAHLTLCRMTAVH